MPDWGLTEIQLGSTPWGLPRCALDPGKVITDPVHGDIHLSQLEATIVDSPAYQRLRYTRQLGQSHYVYPGAVHTRFSHSLGALRVAQLLLDQVWNQRLGIHATDDWFQQWGGGDRSQKRWAEATVVARLGALLHDLCHVPAGHTLEDDLGLLKPHDKNLRRFRHLWEGVAGSTAERWSEDGLEDFEEISETLFKEDGALYQQLLPLIVSKGKHVLEIEALEYPFTADLVGNTICADLLDYLARDHLYAGLPEALGTRFISAFYVVPDGGDSFAKRLAVNIMRGEHERADVITELLKALRYRYELTERVLVHHAKLSADSMLGEAIERWSWCLWHQEATSQRLLDPGHFESSGLPLPRLKQELRGVAPEGFKKVRKSVREDLEAVLVATSDDGLLAKLESLDPESFDPTVREYASDAVALARRLRERRLFKGVARVASDGAPAKELWKRFGDDADRRACLELEAQRFAGLGDEPSVILWVPSSQMRLKLANVLVRHSGGVMPFVAYERAGAKRGSEIYDSHERLWAAYIFVDRSLTAEQRQRVVAYLGKEMGVSWEGYERLGPEPRRGPLRLAVAEVLRIEPVDERIDDEIKEHHRALEVSAARSDPTYEALVERVRAALEPQ